MFKFCWAAAQILVKELQMIFQTSNVSICNGNIKDPIGPSNFHTNFKIFHVSVAVADEYWESKIQLVIP